MRKKFHVKHKQHDEIKWEGDFADVATVRKDVFEHFKTGEGHTLEILPPDDVTDEEIKELEKIPGIRVMR
jgi:hypothetical protein